MTHTDDDSAVNTNRRGRLALLLALAALIAALVGALGSAERLRASYAWPPAALPEGTPERAWYTPLLLIDHRPESLSATIPCAPAPRLGQAQGPATVLATARSPKRAGGLAFVRAKNRLEVSVGRRVLARVRLGGDDPGCAYRFSVHDRRWTLDGGPQAIARTGALAEMPVVYGLLTNLDLKAGGGPSVEVLTRVHATRTISRQAVAWTIAALATAAALALIAFDRRPRPGGAVRRSARATRMNARPADGIVLGTLVGWWVLSPAFFDDGWILAKQSMFSASHGFSTYFVMLGTNAPLGYWLDWLEHWLTQSTNSLVVLRLPALLALASTWMLCRYVLSRVLVSSVGESRVALWGLASAFLAGALAWGMTLRPEPVTALLVTGVLACVVRFLDRGTVAPLALAAVLVPLAISAHPSGIVALAPLLVALPSLFPWVRRNPRAATSLALVSLSILVLVSFVGSDFEQRWSDTNDIRGYGGVVSWYDELKRYELLSAFPYGTPLRRLSVALMVLAIAAFVLRRRRERLGSLAVPAAALTVGAVLLVATPSKWPWHFGTLLGLVAVAVGAETARLHEARRESPGRRVWPFVAVVAAVLAGAWAWGTRAAWNLVDLRTLDWHLGFEGRISPLDVAILLPLLLLLVVIPLTVARHRDFSRHEEEPWRIASWTAPLLATPILVFTLVVILADTAKTGSWTLARQNLESIVSDADCGLAQEIRVPGLSSVRALSLARVPIDTRSPIELPPPPAGLSGLLLAATRGQPASTSWFELPEDRRVGLFVAGVPAPDATLELEWGRPRSGRVLALGMDPIASVASELPDSAPWQLYTTGELPVPPLRAALVRVVYRIGDAGGALIAVTPPVTYAEERLATLVGAPRTLVHPDLLPYFPCARLPRLRDGVAEVPRYLVAAGHPALPRPYVLSPFAGITDLFEVERLSTADSENPPSRVFVYSITEPAGVLLAPPTRVTVVS